MTKKPHEIVTIGALIGIYALATSVVAAIPMMMIINSLFSTELLRLIIGAEQATYGQILLANILICVLWFVLRSLELPVKELTRWARIYRRE